MKRPAARRAHADPRRVRDPARVLDPAVGAGDPAAAARAHRRPRRRGAEPGGRRVPPARPRQRPGDGRGLPRPPQPHLRRLLLAQRARRRRDADRLLGAAATTSTSRPPPAARSPRTPGRRAGRRLAEPERGDIETAVGTVRYLAVPVRFGNEVRGVFVVAASLDSEREEVEEAVRLAALVLISVLLIASALAWVVAGRILSPLRLLADTARSIGESDLTRRIPVSGKRRDRRAGHDVQRDARPARGRVRDPARVRQRRQPRAADADHDRPRPPRAARRRPAGAARDDHARHRRARPHEPLRRRPAAAGQVRARRLPQGLRARARRADRRAVRQGGRARPPRLAAGGARRGAAGRRTASG